MLLSDSFENRIKTYQNTSEHNDSLHADFSQILESVLFLVEHRKYIETHKLGFGDSAFHYMWYLILQHLAKNFSNPKLLEIGVYKGQVISLWSLIALKLSLEISVKCISPLEGNPKPKSKWVRKFKAMISPKFSQDLQSGNFYEENDYYSIISDLFKTFHLDFSKLEIIKGYSNEPSVLEKVANQKFSLIYIDGDHSFEGATQDIKNYVNLIETNGFLVMDDASYYLPGNNFWKGHETVSRACEIIPSLGFTNVINVGHNRVYKKVK